MTSCIFRYCCAIIILLLGSDTSANFSYEKELYDGSECTTEQGRPGICKKLPECLPKLNDVLAERRTGNAADRCGFDGRIEIVCCAIKIAEELRIGPADIACKKLDRKVASRSHVVARSIRDEDGYVIEPQIGATLVIESEFPYMAYLGYGDVDSTVYDCGGSVITPRYTLTAAHCVINREKRVPRWVKIEFQGENEQVPSLMGSSIPIIRNIPHPRYRLGQHYHDIALVETERMYGPNDVGMIPVCLEATALSNVRIDSTTSFVSIGIGLTDLHRNRRPDGLMKSANLTLVPVSKCNESYVNFAELPRGIDDTMICTVDANTTRASNPCDGDSGGPLLMITREGHALIAVTAFGQNCETVVPSVYTSVAPYMDWIQSTIWPKNTEANDPSPT